MSNVGRVLYGYHEGEMGRDHYHSCRIEAEGWDWIVVRSASRTPEFVAFPTFIAKHEALDRWSDRAAYIRSHGEVPDEPP